MQTYNNARKEAVLQPRLMSVQSYQVLFEQALTHSWLRKRQDDTDEEIKKLKEEIAQLKVRDDQLQTNIENESQKQTDALQASIAT